MKYLARLVWTSLVLVLGITGAAAQARVPFKFLDNRVFVPVTLDGRGPYSLILDTGSSDWDVSRDIARQLALKPQSSKWIQGAGESKVQSNTLHVAQTTMGPERFRDQLFYSTDFGILNRVIGFRHFDGIAGAQVFRHYAVGIDFDKGYVEFTPSTDYKAPAGSIAIAFTTPDGSTPLVSGSIACVTGKFIVDTGDRSSLTIFGPFWRAHALDRHFGNALDALTGYGAGGPIRGLIVRVPRFEFGGAHADGVVARLSLQRSGGFADPSIAGSIGNGILRRFHVTFDYAHNIIVLQPGAGFAVPDRFDRSGLWLGRGDVSGLAIYDVIAGSPAAQAGLRVGDIVTAIDAKPAAQIDLFALRARLSNPHASDGIVIAYRRGDKTGSAKFTLRDLVPG